MDIKTILERGVENVIVKENLEKKLKSGKKLRIKLGIDPTGSDLHIGHSVVLRKLRHFQDAGHQIILLIGDYTARIGDPTGKSETRTMLTEDQIKANMQHYIIQASKIVDIEKAEIRHNSEWFAEMTMADILNLTAKKTVNQLMQREDFKNRIKNQTDVSMVEMMYPLMQGYDSVALNCDVEIGGTDQLFNMLVGRDLQKAYGMDVIQDVMTCTILEGLDGVEKMSKSLNNYIGITEAPKEMYGKTLSIPDNLIVKYFELATTLPSEEIEKVKKALDSGENPRTAKMLLAREIASLYHNTEAAAQAEEEFIRVFSNKELPTEIELKHLKEKSLNIIELLFTTGLTSTKSEARRLIEGGGVKVNSEKVASIDAEIDLTEEQIIQAGKRKFLRVKSNAE